MASSPMKPLVELWRRRWFGHPNPWPLLGLYWAGRGFTDSGLYLSFGPARWQTRILPWNLSTRRQPMTATAERQPASAWSALTYPAAAVLLLTTGAGATAAVFAATLLFLGVATFAFHWQRSPVTVDLDHAGMNAALAALATAAVGAPWWLVAVAAVAAAVVLEYVLDVPNRHLMGVWVFAAIAAAGGVGSWWMLVAALVFLTLGFAVWREGNRIERTDPKAADGAHALWHGLTAFGLVFLYMAATGVA